MKYIIFLKFFNKLVPTKSTEGHQRKETANSDGFLIDTRKEKRYSKQSIGGKLLEKLDRRRMPFFMSMSVVAGFVIGLFTLVAVAAIPRDDVRGQVEMVAVQDLPSDNVEVLFTIEGDDRQFTYSTATGWVCDAHGPTGGCFDRGKRSLAHLQDMREVKFAAFPTEMSDVWEVLGSVSFTTY